jgi:hypothetical protein
LPAKPPEPAVPAKPPLPLLPPLPPEPPVPPLPQWSLMPWGSIKQALHGVSPTTLPFWQCTRLVPAPA